MDCRDWSHADWISSSRPDRSMPAPGDEGEDTTVSMGSERAGVELARVSSSAPSGAETVGVVPDRVILERFRWGARSALEVGVVTV